MEDQLKHIAKTIIGRYSPTRFAAAFGVSVQVVVLIVQSLQTANITPKLIHILWTLHFLKTYPTEILGSAAWNVDSKTWTKYVRQTIEDMNIGLPDVFMIYF